MKLGCRADADLNKGMDIPDYSLTVFMERDGTVSKSVIFRSLFSVSEYNSMCILDLEIMDEKLWMV